MSNRPAPEKFALALRHCIAVLAFVLPCSAAAETGRALPIEALEAQGVVIRAIRINAGNVFDLAEPSENHRLFAWVNALHVTTRPALIEAALLFRVGEKISKQRIEETERLLRQKSFLHEVKIRAVNLADGAADLEVATKDAWSLSVGVSGSSAGGTNKTSVDLREYNFLGTGLQLGISRRADSERKGTLIEAAYRKAFDGWTEIVAVHSRFDDGTRRAASIVRPFYALDTRWAAGIGYDNNDRIDSLYREGDTAAEYRHVSRTFNTFAGVSQGLREGWVTRWQAGFQVIDHAYAREPGRTAPATLPVATLSRAPFVEFNLIEDRFLKLQNRNRLGQDEFLAMGLNLGVRLGYSATGLGASTSTPVGMLSIAKGFAPWPQQNLLTGAYWERRLGSTGGALDQFGASFRYFIPQSRGWLMYVAGSHDVVRGGGVADQFLIGGNSGLRGYPARYQTGEKRALLTVEQRLYTDWYPFRLLRVGGAVFFDMGRAWQGENQNRVNSGTLRDAGVGLRLAIDRAAFPSVLHIDVAMPMDRTANIKARQYLVKTEVNF
jgi:Omp85 superfamily domain